MEIVQYAVFTAGRALKNLKECQGVYDRLEDAKARAALTEIPRGMVVMIMRFSTMQVLINPEDPPLTKEESAYKTHYDYVRDPPTQYIDEIKRGED